MTPRKSKVAKLAAAAGAGVGVGALLRDPARRDRLRRVVAGLREALLPPRSDPLGVIPPENDAHAPGHRHRPPPASERPPNLPTEAAPHTVVSHRSGHVHKG
jgi:hypothetical protein